MGLDEGICGRDLKDRLQKDVDDFCKNKDPNKPGVNARYDYFDWNLSSEENKRIRDGFRLCHHARRMMRDYCFPYGFRQELLKDDAARENVLQEALKNGQDHKTVPKLSSSNFWNSYVKEFNKHAVEREMIRGKHEVCEEIAGPTP